MTTEKAVAQRDTSVITQNGAMYLLKTIWPGAPETEIIKAGILCRQYNLNPLMRQVYLVQFGSEWVTILGIKATRQIAQQALRQRGIRYSYQDGPRVMTEKEQAKIRGKIEPDKIWAITVIKDSFDNLYPGYGFWPAGKQPYGSDKGNDALNMAFIRSERNALDKLAPGELPDIDTGDENYVVGDFKVALARGKQQVSDNAKQDIEDGWGDLTDTRQPEASEEETGGVEQTDEMAGYVNMTDLNGQLKALQDKGIKAYSNKNILSYLNAITGQKFDRIEDAVAKLNREQAETFVRKVSDSLEMS